jgi:hypothetical protein
VVTLPGTKVPVKMKAFVGLLSEMDSITGHEHVLVVLTAAALLILVTQVHRVEGTLEALAGILPTAGYVVSSGATVFYMFMDSNPVSSIHFPYVEAGIVAMTVGVGLHWQGL